MHAGHMAKKTAVDLTQTKQQIMHDLLGWLGSNQITLTDFHRRLKQNDMTDDDIDRYLANTLTGTPYRDDSKHKKPKGDQP